MEEVTIKNYQQLAMRTCLPSAKNWQYCYCLIASEVGEAFGKWGKQFRDGEFDKDKLADELGDVFWGVALACELGEYNFRKLWRSTNVGTSIKVKYLFPKNFMRGRVCLSEDHIKCTIWFAKTFAKQCGIDPLDCLRRNIAKLAGRKERGTLTGNGDNR